MTKGNFQKSSSNGLEGISIGTTTLSDVDGERGHLTICGYDVEDLAKTKTFEDIALLLFQGSLPTTSELANFTAMLDEARASVLQHIDDFVCALRLQNPLESLRAAVALLREQEVFETSAALVLASIPLFIGGWKYLQNPAHDESKLKSVLTTRPRQSTAEVLLHVLGAKDQSDAVVKALNAYLLTVSDHGMNASTFTARVIASTQSDVISAVTGAIGALKGPLHGGAPGPVLAMLDEIAHASNARAWIAKKLAAGERIMGMGHRIYKVRDPRAAVFEEAVGSLFQESGHSNDRLLLARAVEQEAESQLALLKPQKPLKANVEFYTSVLLEACDIPGALFTSIFAAGRAAGWLAHFKEQKTTGRLIRPTVDYVGPSDKSGKISF